MKIKLIFLSFFLSFNLFFIIKVNYGCLLLEALLHNCPFVYCPIIFSEIAGRKLYRIEYKDVGKESEQQSLTNLLPIWILDPLTNVCFYFSINRLSLNFFIS